MIEIFYINEYDDSNKRYYDMLAIEDDIELVRFSSNSFNDYSDQALIDFAFYKFDIWQPTEDESGNILTKKVIDKIYIGYGDTARIIFG